MYTRIAELKLILEFVMLGSLVAARVLWRLLPRIPWLGLVHFSRLSRRLSRAAQGESNPTLSGALLTPLFLPLVLHLSPQEVNDAKNDLRGKGVSVD